MRSLARLFTFFQVTNTFSRHKRGDMLFLKAITLIENQAVVS